MPSREDEYWAARKEPRGRGLCPRCGSSNLSCNEKFKTWRCNKCEHSFPTPSYGPGWDFSRESRRIGETPERLKRDEVSSSSPAPSGRAWFGSEYYDSKSRKWKRPVNNSLAVKKAFLILLAFACLGFIGWAGYLLSANEVSPLTGSVIIVLGIGVLIWNISKLKKYRIGAWTLASLFLVVALLGSTVSAYAGIEPLSGVKDKIASSFRTDIEARILPRGVSFSDRYCSVQVELTPSDSMQLDSIYSIQLISSEGYSFGRYLAYWTSDNSRTIKTRTFMIPVSDKVDVKIKNLDEEVLAKLFYGEDLVSVTDWYEASLNKILKVKIISNIELVTEAIVYKETFEDHDRIFAILTPSSSVGAGEIYSVQLHCEVENDPDGYGSKYLSKSVIWRPAEIDAKEAQTVDFGKFAKSFWESYTFSIKVLPSE